MNEIKKVNNILEEYEQFIHKKINIHLSFITPSDECSLEKAENVEILNILLDNLDNYSIICKNVNNEIISFSIPNSIDTKFYFNENNNTLIGEWDSY